MELGLRYGEGVEMMEPLETGVKGALEGAGYWGSLVELEIGLGRVLGRVGMLV